MDMTLSKLWGIGERQGSLVHCSPWGCKESDTTEQLNWTELTKCSALLLRERAKGGGRWEKNYLWPARITHSKCFNALRVEKNVNKCSLWKLFSTLFPVKTIFHTDYIKLSYLWMFVNILNSHHIENTISNCKQKNGTKQCKNVMVISEI